MIARPDHLTVRPNLRSPAMIDPLSEVLRSVRLTGGIFLDARFSAPWCVHTQILAEDCGAFPVRPPLLIAYHFVISGKFLLSTEGEPAVEVRAGEIVLLPRNDIHTLASAAGLKPTSARHLIQPSEDGGLAKISHGGGGETAHLVCGFLGSEESYNPLIATLPRVLKLDVREGVSRDWVEASVRYAASELTAGRFASSSLMSRLSELLFVEAMRQYSVTFRDHDAGWLKGVADPQIGRALAAIHHNIREAWSADSLAREVSMSRSAFVDRFTTLVGMPPIRYLTIWRLQAAKLGLRETRKTIEQLAQEAGYGSGEAFSRAFKREFGLSPALWRDQRPVNSVAVKGGDVAAHPTKPLGRQS
jgi:AraC-like DNA-binding protein